MNFKIIFLAITFLFSPLIKTYASAEFLVPPSDKKGLNQYLVFIPGAKIKNENYEDLLKKIQIQNVRPLWVISLKFMGNMPQPIKLKQKVNNALKKLSSRLALPINLQDVWISGHSLGGINASRIAKDYAGLLLFSSYFDRLSKHESLPYVLTDKPALVLSGELDGLNRPIYVVRDSGFDTTRDNPNNWTKLVLLLPKINHSLLAFDDTLMPGDIPAEISVDEGREIIARTIASFIEIHSFINNDKSYQSALSFLQEIKRKSNQLMRPYLESQSLDQSLCADLQSYLLKKDITTPLEINIHLKMNEKLYSYALTKPKLFSRSFNKVDLEVIQYNKNFQNLLDNSLLPLSPKSISCKMKSSQAVAHTFGLPGPTSPTTCDHMQRYILKSIFNLLNDHQINRYERSSKVLEIEEERTFKTGPGWLLSPSPIMNKSSHRLQAQSLYTSLKINPKFRGMSYCKIASYGRLVEWILTDALTSD